MTTEGIIYNIQRYSINDGPGIRTTVFFKGCPLKCLWCSNPESQAHYPQMLYFDNLCTGCHRCIKACPAGAGSVNSGGLIKIDRDKCQGCGTCVKACLNEARSISGKSMKIDDVFEIVNSDRSFYVNSGGGVTASGGEPTLQHNFLIELFRRCYDHGIDTALDTCGYVSWSVLENVLEYTDLVLYDIKHMDSTRHEELTGVNNKIILDNARRIVELGKPIIIRVPLIPEYNDSKENIEALGKFVSELKIARVDLVPYHQLGVSKYRRLGKVYKLDGVQPYTENHVESIQKILESYDAEVTIA